MHSIRKVAYSSVVGLLLLAPYLASAQWTLGQTNIDSTGLPGGSIYNIISAAMRWLLAILGFIAIIGFVISGIMYLTAAGNETQIEKAKSAMLYSIIGVIVALMGYVIVQAVDAWLRGSGAQF